MKTIFQQGTILGSTILCLHACQVQDDSIGVNIKSEMSKEKSSALTCDDLLNAPEEFKDKIISLSAINWGSSPSADGEEILMSIDDEILQGLQQAHVLVHFSKKQEKEIQGFKENDSISLTAKVGAIEYGALRLIEPKISPN
jgi:hypothetical protein